MKHLFKLHKILFSFLLAIICVTVSAQHITTSRMLKDSAAHLQKNRVVITDTSAAFEEKLVRLALNGPTYNESEYQKKISEHELTKAKNSWLDLLTISTNYNDQSFAPKNTQTTQSNYVYPKYYFGISVPVGLIFTRGSDIKIAKENVSINKDRQLELERNIRADVLSKYKQYKSYGELMAIQNELIDDEQAVFLQTEQKFRDGTITIDVYNTASKNYNAEVANKINLQLQQDLVKLEIEKLIGMRLEDALSTPY